MMLLVVLANNQDFKVSEQSGEMGPDTPLTAL